MDIKLMPPELDGIPDDESHYEQRKAILKRHYEITSRINYAFTLLAHTSWWIGWRGSMITVPRIVYGSYIDTAAVTLDPNNGTIQLFFNGNWAQNLSSGDLAFVYAHETMHAVFDHTSRHKHYYKLWNIVCDAFINEYLHRFIKWNEGTEHKDRLDYVLNEGIRWSSLPKNVRDVYPVENMNDFTADQIYLACLDDMKSKGVDTKMFRLGAIKRKKSTGANGLPPGKPTRQTVQVKVGDLVRVKSKNVMGKIKSIGLDTKGAASTVEVEELSPEEVKSLMLKPTPGTTKGPNAK